jgi:hypothetical protein
MTGQSVVEAIRAHLIKTKIRGRAAMLFAFAMVFVSRSVSADDWVPPKYWICKSALYWSAVWKGGKRSANWHATPEVGGVPGKSDSAALVFAHEVHKIHLQRFDLAGSRSRSFSNMTGACWNEAKPAKPLGWPNQIAW